MRFLLPIPAGGRGQICSEAQRNLSQSLSGTPSSSQITASGTREAKPSTSSGVSWASTSSASRPAISFVRDRRASTCSDVKTRHQLAQPRVLGRVHGQHV